MSLFFLAFLCIISNGQTIVNPTTSNSTGDYYITDPETNFNQSEIECSSNIACYIECNTYKSCQQLTIDCGSAAICDIQCDESRTCLDLSINISPENTTLSCSGRYSCLGILTLYNDYTTYPLSTTILSCTGFYSCGDITIKDASSEQDNYDELTMERFKVYCEYSYSESCNFANYSVTNPTAIPSIINETGEYYSNTGSLVNFECNTVKLCYIHCSNGGCNRSKFDCGDAEECTIFCGYDTGCERMDVTIAGVDIFNFYCAESSDCGWSDFNLTNIGTVNITCDGDVDCAGIDWVINSVETLNVFCNFYWSCIYSDWWLSDVDNAVIICNGSCRYTEWELINVGYQKFDCIGDVINPYSLTDYEACNDININGVDTPRLDMLCENEHACQDMTICIGDNILNLGCLGNRTCNGLNLCDETLSATSAQPTAPSEAPTTAQPTTHEPTPQPTTLEPTPRAARPTNVGNRLIGIYCMAMLGIIAFVQII